jgi:predicted transcriptional regulator of viral defense system
MSRQLREAERIFREHHGVLRMADAIRAGIHRRTLYGMLEAGRIERLSRGLYRLTRSQPLAHPDLVTVATRVPQGVIFLISALSFHELTTQIPHEVYVAVPLASRLPKLDYPPIRAFRVAGKAYSAGIEDHKLDGTLVRIYSREKTIADCFKYRNKIGLDVCLDSLKSYKQQRKTNVDALLRYARIDRVAQVMRPYLEATL